MEKPVNITQLIEEAKLLAAKTPGVIVRLRKPGEERSFEAYVALPAVWRQEKRLLLILVAANGSLIVAIAPPVPHPYCVSRGRDEPIEAKAVDEALYELNARYTSWCRVFLPPGLQAGSIRELVERIVELGLLDEIGVWP